MPDRVLRGGVGAAIGGYLHLSRLGGPRRCAGALALTTLLSGGQGRRRRAPAGGRDVVTRDAVRTAAGRDTAPRGWPLANAYSGALWPQQGPACTPRRGRCGPAVATDEGRRTCSANVCWGVQVCGVAHLGARWDTTADVRRPMGLPIIDGSVAHRVKSH
ncbi:hypothetical protein PHLGIDRAFT_393667 [Phlebiopsis gigantea 11061_1 CR5-6]|uniref:Uncharacterized protein n=1 Tax=Phlebiopsis gigantea (strain 11061_1 CR5-6) TaxID=745531 RepID=A0A0C3PMV2_PHLG1|nr:hypothetical protein PHLGIDRAFT_393667 [Phlebiopsis gigantea 11061_1 CR5-6]